MRSPRTNLALGALRTAVEYVAVVMGGAAVLTGALRGIGFMPSPAPAGLIKSIWMALVTFLWLLQLPGPVFAWILAGIVLFVCAHRAAGWDGKAAKPLLVAASVILSAIVAALFTPAYVPVLFTPALGLLVSRAMTAICAGLMGAFFGLVLLPRIQTDRSPMHPLHWIAAGLWALSFLLGSIQHMYMVTRLAAATEPGLTQLYATWTPGDLLGQF